VTPPPNRCPWPPLIYLAAIAASVLLAIVYPLPWIGGPLADILFAAGWLTVAAAIAIDIAALRALRQANTTVLPNRVSEHLVTSGPFALTRNPIYLGNTMLTTGIGLIVGSVWFLLFAVLAAFVTQKLTIEREERHLEARFGKRYRDYRHRVRRWL
jgi:protein-S-isoprenylcysteine O-methyltransferase Ste14